MGTTARLLALLDLLQDRGWVSGDEIARRIEAEPRTVRRDLARLADLGLPVESRRGRHGGYRLRPGFRMPPLMLTDDEAASVVLALVTAQHLGLATAAPAVDGALTKIRKVLPAALRDRTRSLESSLGFTSSPGDAPGLDAAVLRCLGGPTPPPPSGFDPVTAVSSSLAQAPWRWQVEIRVQASTGLVRERLPAWVATLSEGGDGFVRAVFRAESLEGAARMLAALGLPFTVVGPDELRLALATHARALLAATDRPGEPAAPEPPSRAPGSP